VKAASGTLDGTLDASRHDALPSCVRAVDLGAFGQRCQHCPCLPHGRVPPYTAPAPPQSASWPGHGSSARARICSRYGQLHNRCFRSSTARRHSSRVRPVSGCRVLQARWGTSSLHISTRALWQSPHVNQRFGWPMSYIIACLAGIVADQLLATTDRPGGFTAGHLASTGRHCAGQVFLQAASTKYTSGGPAERLLLLLQPGRAQVCQGDADTTATLQPSSA
jgi:hypothetical protein